MQATAWVWPVEPEFDPDWSLFATVRVPHEAAEHTYAHTHDGPSRRARGEHTARQTTTTTATSPRDKNKHAYTCAHTGQEQHTASGRKTKARGAQIQEDEKATYQCRSRSTRTQSQHQNHPCRLPCPTQSNHRCRQQAGSGQWNQRSTPIGHCSRHSGSRTKQLSTRTHEHTHDGPSRRARREHSQPCRQTTLNRHRCEHA